jgi:hypothetical protein
MSKITPIRLPASLLALLVATAWPPPAAGEPVYHAAENRVPVVMTDVLRYTDRTEIRLKILKPLKAACWAYSGANSPYLLADGRRHRFLSGENIAACPTRKPYQANAVMILRFEPLGQNVRAFHLVEGRGGENQLIDPSSSRNRYWNFLKVRLR